MLQGNYVEEDVGKVESLATAYRRLKNDLNMSQRGLRAARAELVTTRREAKRCEIEQNQKARFFDRRLLHPVVSIAPDAWAIAKLLATLIEIDRRTGQTRRPVAGLKFEKDKGVDLFSAPAEVNKVLRGDCAKFVRQEGAFRGKRVGCGRVPGGFHVWLEANGQIIDVCVDRGMAQVPPAVYAAGQYAEIAQSVSLRPRVFDDDSEMDAVTNLGFDDETPWPTIDDADQDAFGVDGDLVSDDDDDVAGAGKTAGAIIGIAGAIGGILGTVYGGPATGAAINTVAQTTASVVSSLDEEAPKALPPKQRLAAARTVAQKQVAAAQSRSLPSEEAATLAAFAALTSGDPNVLANVQARLLTPRETDANPITRMALEAALVGLHQAGLQSPFATAKPARPRLNLKSMLEKAEPTVEGVDADEILSIYSPDCPGTCAAS